MQKIRSDNGKEYTNENFDKFCEEADIEHQLTSPYTPQQNGVKRDKLDKKAELGVFIGYSNSSKAYRIFQPQNGKILIKFEEVEKDDKWIEAMKEELRMIEKNDTWELVDKPQHRKVIGVKWVYRTKLNADARLDTIRMLLALTAQKGWKTYQLDVIFTFLNGYLQEEIYVEQPKGFQVKGQKEKVYLLKKGLYGLNQAPRAWYSRIDEHLQSLRFVKSPSSNEKLVKEFKAKMLKVFEMTDLGLMSYFLDCKRTSTPMNQKKKFSKDDGAEKVDESQYRSLIGCLMNLIATRPDIMFSVSLLSRFMHCVSEVHFQAAKRIVLLMT
ncbi:Retrovirus-related Pol polyprotein from transposon RE1 [Vitis vinifera]|uniref:Retrovirus-related Pol polyprotein from transposon RE1 n=1 Tax=Vitis vinifera TaxID=29760 RepID=A0A438I4Y7_VITVI|nr:Retrovirus-related Pol polyprotein from transposon RE1 [Vitis vinifera]